jgi:beta-lactamase superfamily II metal-dependent hydrolase
VTIHCLDVGQGDATLIVSSSGQTMLVDGGENGMGSGVIVPYLTSLGIDELDYMIATHYHSDHIGGLDEVYHQIGVSQQVYDRGWSYSSAAFDQYAQIVFLKRTTINEDQIIDLGDGVTVTCLGFNGNGVISAPYNVHDWENEYSIALLVQAGDFDFFVAGDLIGINYNGHRDIESSIAPETGDIEVYQVNHQCSYTSSNTYFIGQIQPEVAIVSVGPNPYGHPHQDILNRLSNAGSFIYQTEAGSGGTLPPEDLRVVNDHIVITTDGYEEYWVDGDQYLMDEPPSSVPVASRFELHGNYPNPFNPTTSILFKTQSRGPALLTIFDLSGRRIYEHRFLAHGGQQSIQWQGISKNGTTVPTGVYIYRLQVPDGEATDRMTLIK